jgi:predicted dehydrogenase
LKTAIIGLGPHGLRLVTCVQELPDFELVAVVDNNNSAISKLPSDIPVKKYSNLDNLFNIHKLDVIIIATNGPSHHDISLRAMKEGIRKLFISKPLACSVADARSIVEIAKKTGTRIVVDHGLRHDPNYLWIKEQIEKQVYGNLRSVYIQRPGIGLGCLGVHSFDLANYLIKSEVETVTAWVDEPLTKNPRGDEFIDPGGLVVIKYRNSSKAIILQVEDGSGPMSVELNFNFARIKVDEKFGVMEVVSKDPKFKPSPGNPVVFNKAINPTGLEVKHDIFFLMKGLLTELIGKREMRADVKNGLVSVEILTAAYQSSEQENIAINIPVSSEDYCNRFLPVT